MAIVKRPSQNPSDTIFISRRKLTQTLTILPTLLFLLGGLAYGLGEMFTRPTPPQTGLNLAPEPVNLETHAAYPNTGAALNPNLFSRELPPPPLDALPYDVREPLSNGDTVPVKKRWIWLPANTVIEVRPATDGGLFVDIPIGATWWKEFYLEHDRSTFLIERRIIRRVNPSNLYPEGWAYYSAHYRPENLTDAEALILSSLSTEAGDFAYQPTDWLPTQFTSTLEVRFEDERGLQYPYVFPGDAQCLACHGGATGAYPNDTDNAIQVFGLHPNNLTPESFTALVNRGWLTNGDLLLTDNALEAPYETTLDELTTELVGVIRNNCASCHNASPDAAASISGFIIDPNKAYTTEELMSVLGVTGKMTIDAHPIVTAGNLEESEVWLRLNGLDGRRRMPPREGGLPEPSVKIVGLWQEWILRTGEITSP